MYSDNACTVGSERSSYVTLSCWMFLIVMSVLGLLGAQHIPHPGFLFGCVSVGVNVNETFLLLSDWKHSASLLIGAQLSTSLSMNSSKPLTTGVFKRVHGHVCLCVCACVVYLLVCEGAPVSIANVANQSWLLVTTPQRGDLWVDEAVKHMMWL